jgi:hypothetical protein
MALSSGPPERTRIIHHGTDDLLLKERAVSDGQAASPVKERAKQARSLSCLSSHLVGLYRPGQLFIKGNPNIQCSFDPFYWLSERLD